MRGWDIREVDVFRGEVVAIEVTIGTSADEVAMSKDYTLGEACGTRGIANQEVSVCIW